MFLDLGNPVANHPLNDGLIGWWLGLQNNSGGSTLFDLAGRSPGTLTSGCSWNLEVGQLASVDMGGTNNGVTLTLPSLVSPMSFEGYYYIRSAPQTYPMYMGDGTIILGWTTVPGFGGPPYREYYAPGSYFSTSWCPAPPAYVHRVWVYEGGNLTVYADGVAKEAVSYSPGTLTTWRLGGPNDGFLMSDHRLLSARAYGRALSADEAWQLYDQSTRGHPDTLRRWSRRSRGYVATSPPPATSSSNLLLLGCG